MNDLPNPRPDPYFVGDHPALDFLNTVAGDGTDWVTNGADLVDWLERTATIDRSTALKFRAGDHRALDAAAARARVLRDWLRGFLHKHAGKRGSRNLPSDLAPLNALLSEDDSYAKVIARPQVGGHAHLEVARISRWTSPNQLLQPIAATIADLICNEDLRLVRGCEGHACILMFLDRTKSHGRRWCSMAVCGNRAKAAAHRAKARGAERKPA